MATKQSTHAKRYGATIAGFTSGAVMAALVKFEFSEAFTAATDVIELLALPATCKIASVTLETASIAGAATTISVGFMTGDYRDTDAVRTCGSEIIDGAAKNTSVDATLASLNAVTATGGERVIGATIDVNEAAGAGVLYLRVEYYNA